MTKKDADTTIQKAAKESSDESYSPFSPKYLANDLTSSLVVFLVALPLCLGIALASGAPLFSGLLAGIVGGIVVGSLSGSHISVAGPAAGLTAIVAAQIATFQKDLSTPDVPATLEQAFAAFLAAVVIAGVIQVALGFAKAGALSAFFPSSVIKGLLAAIGVLLILKQIPHLLGHDTDAEGEMSFEQPDGHNTFSEFGTLFHGEIHTGAIVIGITCLVFLIVWDQFAILKKSVVPSPLLVVLLGAGMQLAFKTLGGPWAIGVSHLVQIEAAENAEELVGFLSFPDFSVLAGSTVYIAGATIAVVASLETLLNLEAADKLDPLRRNSPPSRELLAQGVGNICGGLIGSLPVTSVVVRSSVNANTGAKTKRSAVLHGLMLMVCVIFLPVYLNMIPLAALAAILIHTGFKLASAKLFKQMWDEGRYQFIPFIVTLVTIVFTDLLIGIVVGLCVSLLFILNSNLRRPIRRIVETHLGGDVLHIELPNQVSFLNRAALDTLLNDAARDSHVLIDATNSDYIDPDILSLISDFQKNVGPAHGVQVSLRGFKDKYKLEDVMLFADYSTPELQEQMTPQAVLEVLKEGNRRFRTGQRLARNLGRQVGAAAKEQHPFAVVLSCIDSRTSSELIFDMGLGDIFSVRIAGNVIGRHSLGSIEYGVAITGVKLVLVLGHSRCGAVTSALEASSEHVERSTGCEHLQGIVDEIHHVADDAQRRKFSTMSQDEKDSFIDDVARQNVLRVVKAVCDRSEPIRKATELGEVIVAGAMYDVTTGNIDFLTDHDGDAQV